MKFGTKIFWFYLIPVFITLFAIGLILGFLVNQGYKNLIVQNYRTIAKNLIDRDVVFNLTIEDLVNENHNAFDNFEQNASIKSLNAIRIKFFNQNGTLVHLDHPDWQVIVEKNKNEPIGERVRKTLKGEIVVEEVRKSPSEEPGEVKLFEKKYKEIFSIYYPIRFTGQNKVLGVIEIYFELDSLSAVINQTVSLIWVYISIGLFLIFIFSLLIYNYTARLYAKQIELQSVLNEQIEIRKLENQFMRIMAHQLRTPLTAVIGNLDIILKNFKKRIPKEINESLAGAAASYNRLAFLTEKILALLDLEKTLTMQIEGIDLNDIAREVIESYQELIKAKGLDLKVRLGKIPKFYGHARYLKTLINEYLDNAIKFTVKGEIQIKTYIADSYAILEVEDTGIGMSTELQKDLFEKLKVIQKPLEELHGMGIGLYICKLIAEKHGGKVWAESKPGKGSKFYASFALSPEREDGKQVI